MPYKGPGDDYVQVNERIIKFIEKYPEGSLQSEIVELTGERVVMRGMAFRNPDDPKPGIGHSWLEIPGKTAFTRGSEIENAETSAWGRALAALGFEVKRGIASAEEVRNKSDDSSAAPSDPTITPSAVPGVERGGRTAQANPIQVRQARLLSRELELGVSGFRDAVERILGKSPTLPEDEEAAGKILVEFLESLSREDIGTLIQGLSAEVEARNGGPGDTEQADAGLA
jgi:hypothetical protein